MKSVFILFMTLSMMAACCQHTDNPPAPKPRAEYAIALHGGAGAIRKVDMTPEKEQAYRAALDTALSVGEQLLRNGGSALDAVTATVSWLEDCPLFNAGRGAVFTHDGRNELDASIMNGIDRKAGAVGGVTTVRHPIQLARTVMEKSPHVFLVGKGAEDFAAEQGLEIVAPAFFYTESRWEALQKILSEENDHSKKSGDDRLSPRHTDYKFGTVGCVALDKNGNLAAGTSTGGMTNKRWNRIGDSPVIGAGTYAGNEACAVSCTGHGEYFIRYAVAYDLWARMVYQGASLESAADAIVHDELVKNGGEGGLIAVDKLGNIVMPFNSAGMYRAYARPGERKIMIYKD